MTRRRTAGFLVVGMALIGVASASGQPSGRPPVPQAGACFYEDINFGGRYFCAEVGIAAGQVPPHTDRQGSSIRVFGNAEVTVYRDANFQGQARNFDSDTEDLRRTGLNDRISSFRVSERGTWGRASGDTGGRRRGMAWGRPSAPRSGVCFYRDINYG